MGAALVKFALLVSGDHGQDFDFSSSVSGEAADAFVGLHSDAQRNAVSRLGVLISEAFPKVTAEASKNERFKTLLDQARDGGVTREQLIEFFKE